MILRPALIAWIKSQPLLREVVGLVSPQYDVTSVASAAEALARVQQTCAAMNADAPISGVVLVAEYSPAAPPSPGEPGPAALLEAVRIRCPQVKRLMLSPADSLQALVALIHSGTVDGFVPLPLVASEFTAAMS